METIVYIKDESESIYHLTKELKDRLINPKNNQRFDGLTYWQALSASRFGYSILDGNRIIINVRHYSDDNKNIENDRISEFGKFHTVLNNTGNIDEIPFTAPIDFNEPIWSVVYPFDTNIE